MHAGEHAAIIRERQELYAPFGIRRLVDGKIRSEILKEILDLVLLSSAKSARDWWHQGSASLQASA
jgi:hypothetical protein